MRDDYLADACILPPALDDVALIAAIDGEADAEVLDHLRVCAACAARASAFATMQRLLRERLYRAFCCASDELADFQQGLLVGDQRLHIAEHLADCEHCARELWLLASALETPFIAHSLTSTAA